MGGQTILMMAQRQKELEDQQKSGSFGPDDQREIDALRRLMMQYSGNRSM